MRKKIKDLNEILEVYESELCNRIYKYQLNNAEKFGIRDEVMKYVRFKRPVLIHYFKFFEVCENINNFLKSF